MADHREFRSRRTTKVVDGVTETGWFTEDFHPRGASYGSGKGAVPRHPAAQHFIKAGDPRTYDWLASKRGLAFIHTYANAIGTNKDRIIPRDASGHLLAPTRIVINAHAAGLLVHTWTLRPENAFLPADFRAGSDPAAWGDWRAEFDLIFSLGVDGVFCDAPDLAVIARADNGWRQQAA